VANPKPKSRRPFKPRRKLSPGQKVTIIVAVIAALGTVGGAAINALLAPHPRSASRGHHRTSAAPSPGIISLLPTFAGARADIQSSNPSVRDQGVNDFNILYPTASPVTQWRIISTLVGFVQDYAPAMPNSANVYAYCLTEPPLSYPADLTTALKIIGSRSDANSGRSVNLSGLNLAYAVLDGLNFANVNFDSDLLCRTIFYDSRFQSASFEGADLRFAIIMHAQGLTVGQLRASYSLCKAKLPRTVAARKPIEYLTHRGLPFCF
jgi:hypothetical protein